MIHCYHKIVLTNDYKYQDLLETRRSIGLANRKIKNPYNLALQKVNKIIQLLHIRFNPLILTKNLNSFDCIKIELINAYLLKTELVIINDLIIKLTQNEIKELQNIVNRMQELLPNLLVIYSAASVLKLKKYCYIIWHINSQGKIETNDNNLNKNQ